MSIVSAETAAKLSIVVGTYNRKDQIQRAVDSIVQQTLLPFHLYITDAGSTDGTIEYLTSLRDNRITPILVGKRIGQARAYNDVFERVATPYVCWLSDDNEIVDGGLDKAVRILENDPSIGMVGLKVKDIVGPFANVPYIGGVSIYGILNVNQGVLPTPIMREMGGFSEEFRDYGIDPDLTARVLLDGHDVVYTRDVAVHHFRNWETDASSTEYARMQERQKAYLELYKTTYRDALQRTPTFMAKRALWKGLRTTLRLQLDSQRLFLGLSVRDWHNVLCTRTIDVVSEVSTQHPLYYLRQRGIKRGNARLIRRGPAGDNVVGP